MTETDSTIKSGGNEENEKGKNKRKFLPEQLTLDLSAEVSLTEFPRYENLVEKFRNAVDEWRAMVQKVDSTTGEEEEVPEGSEWDDPVATELEELLSHNIFTTFITALKRIIECGYTEQVAEWAILNSSFLHGNKDAVSNVVDPALAFLKKQKEFNTPKHSVFEGLENLVDYTLLEMIFVLREVRMDFTVVDAMWGLLINDLNLLNACSMERGPTALLSSSKEASREKIPLSTPTETKTKTATPSESKNSGDALAVVASMGNQQSTCKNGEPAKDLLEAKGNAASVDEKSKKGGSSSNSNSKRDMLRQKTFQFDKSYRGRLSKGAFKAKVAAWGSMVLDKSLKSQSGSSKIAPPPVEEKEKENAVAAPAKIGTDSPSPKSEVDTPEAVDYLASIPFDEALQKHVPRDHIDEALLMLVARKKTLEKELKGWVDWGNEKVMQAAKRLGKDQAELKLLKAEKEEAEKYKREKQTLEENTMKRLSEMEYALKNATAQIEVAKRAVYRLEQENAALKVDMEAAKARALRSAAKLEEALVKEQEYQKKLQAWEGEKSLLLEKLNGLKRQSAGLRAKIDKTKARKEQFELLFKQEEKEKLRLIKEREALVRKREEDEALLQAEMDNLKQIAEVDKNKYNDLILDLQTKISKMRLESNQSKIAALNVGFHSNSGGPTSGEVEVIRERECVMCMTDEISVVFLPCAHQVLCVSCNEIHEKQGMNDCPSCRAKIERRIKVTYRGE